MFIETGLESAMRILAYVGIRSALSKIKKEGGIYHEKQVWSPCGEEPWPG